MSRVHKDELLRVYKIPDFNSIDEFLGQIARKKGFLSAGGIANFDQAARAIIRDYLDGKIKYFTAPPIEMEEEDGDEEMLDA